MRIVVTEPIHEDGVTILRERQGAEVIAFDSPASADELASVIPDCLLYTSDAADE